MLKIKKVCFQGREVWPECTLVHRLHLGPREVPGSKPSLTEKKKYMMFRIQEKEARTNKSVEDVKARKKVPGERADLVEIGVVTARHFDRL